METLLAFLQEKIFRKLFDIGGPERDRTAGLLVANEALSQLSYRPTKKRTNSPSYYTDLPLVRQHSVSTPPRS